MYSIVIVLFVSSIFQVRILNFFLHNFDRFLSKVFSTVQDDIPDRFLELNNEFVSLHDSYEELLIYARGQQKNDERVLQAQLFSRIAFVTSEIKDLDFATHRRIIEHGLRIGNTAAECIIEADTSLQMMSTEAGQELNEISEIASKDFQRIPSEFVHPYLYDTTYASKVFLMKVMKSITGVNAIRGINEAVTKLENDLEESKSVFASFKERLQQETSSKQKEMNYMKAEVFPILEYTLRYFRQGTERIVANLMNCDE